MNHLKSFMTFSLPCKLTWNHNILAINFSNKPWIQNMNASIEALLSQVSILSTFNITSPNSSCTSCPPHDIIVPSTISLPLTTKPLYGTSYSFMITQILPPPPLSHHVTSITIPFPTSTKLLFPTVCFYPCIPICLLTFPTVSPT